MFSSLLHLESNNLKEINVSFQNTLQTNGIILIYLE